MNRATKGPVEAKVVATTVWTAILGVVIAGLNSVQTDPSLLGHIPTVLQSLILVVLPTAITWLVGYKTKHTFRPDLASKVNGSAARTNAEDLF